MYQKKSSLSGRRGLGSLGVQSCTVDPVTNARVCSDGVSPTSPNVVPVEGSLIKGSGDAVHLMQNGQRRWIPNPDTFNCMGFNWSAIQTLPDALFNSIPAGPALTSIGPYPGCGAQPQTITPPTTTLPAIVPVTGTGIIPMPMYPPASGSSGSGLSLASIPSWAKYGGLAVGALFAVKLLMPGGRR